MGKEAGCQYQVDRRQSRRKHTSKKESREQIRKGVGACIFVLGIPCIIAGLIITVVAYTNSDAKAHPSSFPILGPLLIVLAVLCFISGAIMTDMLNIINCWQSCYLNHQNNFCFKRCPKLFSLLYPDEVIRMQQRSACLSALQTVPTKPALKRPVGGTDKPASRHGVHFSANGVYDVAGTSTSSETSNNPALSDSDVGQKNNSPSSSLLSLRHFRITPTEGSTWVEMRHGPPVFEHASFEYVTEFGNPVNGSSAYSQSQTDYNASDQSVAKRFDNQNGVLTHTEPKGKQCDKKISQRVIFNVEEDPTD